MYYERGTQKDVCIEMFYHNKEDVNVIDGINKCLNIFFDSFFFFNFLVWSFNVWGYLWLGLFRSPSACVPKRGTAVVRPHCSCQHYSVHLSRNIGYLASCNRLVTWVVEVVVVGCSMKLLLLFNLLLQKGGGS